MVLCDVLTNELFAGKKLKGKKHEKTTDYVPDLTELDQGALGMDDIAENYGTVSWFLLFLFLSCPAHSSNLRIHYFAVIASERHM